MNNLHLSNLTPYPDINSILQEMTQGLVTILADNLLGLYLFGSLTYGDFNPKSSDIDLNAILNQPASEAQLESLKQLHVEISEKHETWAKRLECSYTQRDILHNILPPRRPRPYVGEGIFYPEAQYGNEWIINLYLLRQHGITLFGPDFSYLVNPIPIVEVQKACIRDLFREWEPKISDPEWFDNSHYQSYIVLNLCRILYTVMAGATGSKKVSAEWVKNEFGAWRDLIQTAQDWHYGVEMTRQQEAIEFIQFVIDQVKQMPLCGQT
jgi:hypothetical protein